MTIPGEEGQGWGYMLMRLRDQSSLASSQDSREAGARVSFRPLSQYDISSLSSARAPSWREQAHCDLINCWPGSCPCYLALAASLRSYKACIPI